MKVRTLNLVLSNSELLMAALTTTNIVDNTFEAVSLYSYQSKVRNEEKQFDELFDAVNSLRVLLSERCDILEKLVTLTEAVTWLKKFSDDDLMKISTTISLDRDIILIEKRTWAEMNKRYKKLGFCSDEIKRYKHVIDDFEEVTSDLYEAIFETPKDEEFEKLNQELQLLSLSN